MNLPRKCRSRKDLSSSEDGILKCFSRSQWNAQSLKHTLCSISTQCLRGKRINIPSNNFLYYTMTSGGCHHVQITKKKNKLLKDHPSIIHVQFGFQLRKEKNIDKAHSYTQTKKNNIKYRQLENNI